MPAYSGLTLNCKSLQLYLGVVSPEAVSCSPMYVQSSIMDCLCSCLLHHHSGRSVLNILLSMKLQESTAPVSCDPALGQFPQGTNIPSPNFITIFVPMRQRHCPLEVATNPSHIEPHAPSCFSQYIFQNIILNLLRTYYVLCI